MTDRPGIPARELSDEELERQGVHAHAMRHWVFLHGTAEQFRTHTERMLELEQEYLRRHPQRTWQGSGGEAEAPSRDDRIRDLVQTFSRAITALLDEQPSAAAESSQRRDPVQAQIDLLRRFAEAPDGRMHKLEAHQIARQLAPDSHLVAQLYRQDPPLLQAERDARVITDAGRAWLEQHAVLGLTESVAAGQLRPGGLGARRPGRVPLAEHLGGTVAAPARRQQLARQPRVQQREAPPLLDEPDLGDQGLPVGARAGPADEVQEVLVAALDRVEIPRGAGERALVAEPAGASRRTTSCRSAAPAPRSRRRPRARGRRAGSPRWWR